MGTCGPFCEPGGGYCGRGRGLLIGGGIGTAPGGGMPGGKFDGGWEGGGN